MIRTAAMKMTRGATLCAIHRLTLFHRPSGSFFRASSTGGGAGNGGKDLEWRKVQLDRVRKNFEGPSIQNDSDLQPMWKEMESRVLRRRSVKIENAGGRVGRSNIRPTDEDSWLRAGMYDHNANDGK